MAGVAFAVEGDGVGFATESYAASALYTTLANRSGARWRIKAANLNINGRNMSVEAAPDTPLLWAIREQLQMTGTKFGCGAGLCGACTVHVNGEAVRSCQTSLSDVAGKKITTIEGLGAKGDHPLQKAWIAEQVPQCGYCQSGQIMQAASLLAKNPNPTKDEVVAHMDGNLCRCMTYSRIQKAIMRAATEMRTASNAGTERRAT